ncbi:pentatricopeptide repeat-containing protein At5g66520 [Sesamum indicum]|uniref:Pentatricopeptide repeat-containing protein At5g66520 n=1 Tax=Sesamum indicum TaxID=4182 RepID=A0A6I9T531_SESIN|nr:pentatricopeptide repeat-containing protein At5g66520 [Sesamum indicum]XP_011078948.1 pentatricopeptide repeat-containing protein At5g66520 [Sesamum indicum]XP_011078949.1 pentatricopeptide repeat-containing protein At5g66520 [Sesamum indicum]
MSSVQLLPATATPSISTAKATPFKNLQSCSTMAELKQHHAHIIKLGLSSDNDAMGRVIRFCALSESGDLNYALKVFASLPHPDAFIYNTMFRGYLEARLYRDCIVLYAHMLEKFVTPNKFSFPPVIRACCVDNAVKEAKQVHAHVIKLGFSEDSFCQNNLIHMYVNFKSLEEAKRVFDSLDKKDDVSWTTLISGYSRWGCVDEAFVVFESLPIKNSAAWNAVIAAHVQNNRFREAFNLFERMRKENVAMDNFVAASMLSACTGLGALEQGEWIYDYIRSSAIEVDPKLATTILDMYCKCGCLDKAVEVFNGLSSKGVSSWNCMIGGFAMHGKGKAAIELLKKMEAETMVTPDYVTFVNVLGACAHSGLVEEGKYYFSYMTEVYGIAAGMEHYGCLVDLLGRAGMLEEARKVINEMPFRPDVGVLGAFLGACRIHGNSDMAEEIGRQVIELEPNNSGRYVLLANLYAKAGRWEDVANIRKLMNDRGVKKVAGFSMIELEGTVSEFIAGGRTHPQATEIYAKLEEMLVRIKDLGYVPDTDGMLYDICEEETENPLHYHSEKLAIAFGLLKTKPGETIRITKNLRVCKDCHQASKLISTVYNREIIVRDRNRFHHFKGGVCSCNDYW